MLSKASRSQVPMYVRLQSCEYTYHEAFVVNHDAKSEIRPIGVPPYSSDRSGGRQEVSLRRHALTNAHFHDIPQATGSKTDSTPCRGLSLRRHTSTLRAMARKTAARSHLTGRSPAPPLVFPRAPDAAVQRPGPDADGVRPTARLLHPVRVHNHLQPVTEPYFEVEKLFEASPYAEFMAEIEAHVGEFKSFGEIPPIRASAGACSRRWTAWRPMPR